MPSGFSRKAVAVADLWIASRSLPPEGGSHRDSFTVFSRKISVVASGTIAAEPQTKQLIIAIDGPSGAGKGTIARGSPHVSNIATSTPAPCPAPSPGRRWTRDSICRTRGHRRVRRRAASIWRRAARSSTARTFRSRSNAGDRRGGGDRCRHPAVQHRLVAPPPDMGRAGDIIVEGRESARSSFPMPT